MTASLQLKGGTAAKVEAYTPLAREIVIDTDNYMLVIGDGVTAGGNPLVVESTQKLVTGRNITFTGAATGEIDSFDGSTDVSVEITLGVIDLGTI